MARPDASRVGAVLAVFLKQLKAGHRGPASSARRVTGQSRAGRGSREFRPAGQGRVGAAAAPGTAGRSGAAAESRSAAAPGAPAAPAGATTALDQNQRDLVNRFSLYLSSIQTLQGDFT